MCTRCWEEHCLCRDSEMSLFVLDYCCTASHKCQTRWMISSKMVNMVTLCGCSFVRFNLYIEKGKHCARVIKWWTNWHNNMIISQLVLSLSTLHFPPLIFEPKPSHSVLLNFLLNKHLNRLEEQGLVVNCRFIIVDFAYKTSLHWTDIFDQLCYYITTHDVVHLNQSLCGEGHHWT